MHYTSHIDRLIDEFAKLPGIGKKTAQRLAFYIINQPEQKVRNFAEALIVAKDNIAYCEECCNIADKSPCGICASPNRDSSLLMVVEEPQDVAVLERTKEYKGKYHILHGTISPMDSIGPELLRIKELVTRLSNPDVKEVILATNPTINGEATAMYIARLIKPFGVKVTRIAHGLPVGANIEFADDVTIGKALEGRREI
ncbi:MAG: recombination mediator RecR [Filifactoraceae bacterium]